MENITKKLLKFDLFLLVTLVILFITYYQIKDAWELEQAVALSYSFLLAFGVAGFVIWVRK
jgi:hypothetical protein